MISPAIKRPKHEANHSTVCHIKGTKLKASAAECQTACFASEIIQLFSTKISEIQFLNSYWSNINHAIHEFLTELSLISKSGNSPHFMERGIQYRVHKKPLVPILSQINSVHTLSSYIFHIRNIMLQTVSSLHVFQPKHCKHVPSRPRVLKASPASSSSI